MPSANTNNTDGSTNMLLAWGSVSGIVAMMVTSHFSYELFGIEPGNAGHNFGLGMIFMALSLPILGISIWAFVETLVRWKDLNDLHRYGTTIPSTVVLVFYAYLLTPLLT